jgi:2-dehydro-3-deoxygluconokinase
VTALLTYGETMGALHELDLGPLSIGSTMRTSIAGAEATVAIGVNRLGGSARWVGVVGDDPFGTAVLTCLRGEGVAVDGVTIDPAAPTGLLVKERRTATSNVVRYYRAGSAGSRLGPEHVQAEHVDDAQLLLVSGITPALSTSAALAIDKAIALARSRDSRICLDINYRSRLWTPATAAPVLRRLVAAADLVFATTTEAEVVLGRVVHDPSEAVTALANLTTADVVLKLGARGALARTEDGLHEIPARRVDALDPVGAGDAFVAGTIADLLAGTDLCAALTTGSQVAALAVCVPGDWEGLPTRAELVLLADGAEDIAR